MAHNAWNGYPGPEPIPRYPVNPFAAAINEMLNAGPIYYGHPV